jgi:phosphatidylglycerol:prolipoprotein diacylglycerol transferase
VQVDAHLIHPNEATLLVHPTQIYLAALNLLTFFLLYFVLRPRKRFDGYLFAWLLICKGVFRALVEVWRDDDRGVLFGWLSTSQMISVPLVAIGIWLLVRARREQPAIPGAVAAGT